MSSQETKFNLRFYILLALVAATLFALHFGPLEASRNQLEAKLMIPIGSLWIPVSAALIALVTLVLRGIYASFLEPLEQIADDCVRGKLSNASKLKKTRETRIIVDSLERGWGCARENKKLASKSESELSQLRKAQRKAIRRVAELETELSARAREDDKLRLRYQALLKENEQLKRQAEQSVVHAH